MKRALLIPLLSVLSHVKGDCPTLEELSDQRIVPEITQVDSEHALVEWSGLWDEMDWTNCLSSAAILINGEEEQALEDLSGRNQTVKVEPCEETTAEIKVTLSETGEEALSFRSKKGFKTYKSPLTKEETAIEFSHHVDDKGVIVLTKADVRVKFNELVYDPSCRRVFSSELRFRRDGDEIWTVVKTFEVFRTLDETIEGFDDLCSGYEVVLQLMGAPGTEDMQVPLGTLEAVSPELMKEAYESGFRYQPPKPSDLTLSSSTDTEAQFSWSKPVCSSGYIATLSQSALAGGSDEIARRKVDDEDETSLSMPDLDPCTGYLINLRSYLSIGDTSFFYESAPVTLPFATKPHTTSEAFELKSFSSRSGRSSITLSWLRNEWPCYDQINVRLCPAGEQDEGLCDQIGEPKIVNDRKVVTFQGLLPCSDYKTIVSPIGLALEDDDDDFIDLDSNESALRYESILTTKMTKRAPRGLDATPPFNATSVALSWTADSCAKAYVVSVQADNGDTNVNWYDASSLDKISPLIESDKLLRKRRGTPEYALPEYAVDYRDANYDYEADREAEEAEPVTIMPTTSNVMDVEGSGEEGSGDNKIDDEDYDYYGSGSGDYYFDYEQSGSGSGMEIEEDTNGTTVRINFDDLEPCTDYIFQVQNVYLEKGKHVRGPESLLEHSTNCSLEEETTTVAPTTTMQPDVDPVSKVRIYEETDLDELNLVVTWTQARGVNVEFAVFNREEKVKTEVVDTTGSSEEEYISKTIAVKFCQDYKISFLDADSGEELHSEGYMTAPNEISDVTLTDFSTFLLPQEKRGVIEISWTHDLACVNRYMVELSTAGKQGEVVELAPELDEKVVTDLHMIPGMLTLENCKEYTIHIYPKSDQASDFLISPWHQGYSMNFKYADDNGEVLNQDPSITVTENSEVFELFWEVPLTCNNIKVTYSTQRQLYPKDDEVAEEHLVVQGESSSVLMDGLLSCLNYNIMLEDETTGTVLFSDTLSTTAGADETVEPLVDEEVKLWIEQSDFSDAKVEWTKRCDIETVVETCLQPLECEEDGLEIHEATEENEESSSESATLTNLSPCSSYKYFIRTSQDQLLFEGNFSSAFGEELMYEPEHFEVAQSDEDIKITWLDYAPCIQAYEISIVKGTEEILSVPVNKSGEAKEAASLTLSDFLKLDELDQCADYEIALKPLVDVENADDWQNDNMHFQQMFYFTRPLSPTEANFTVQDSSTVKVSWGHLSCHTGYQIEFSDNIAEILSEEVAESSREFNDLLPCTQYNLKVWSKANDQVSETSFNYTFMTDHSEDVQIETSISFENVTLEVFLHGTDCLKSYVMYLCDFESTRTCKNQTLVPGELITFVDLSDGAAYSYQLIGFNEHDMETFFTPEYQIRTRKRISAELVLDKATETTLELRIESTIFEDTEETQWNASVSCDSGDFSTELTVTEESVKFENLDDSTSYECSGMLFAADEVVDLSSITANTSAGVPDAPVGLTGHFVAENSSVVLEWEEPDDIHGNISEYRVFVRPECQPKIGQCEERCLEVIEVTAVNTTLELSLEPFVNYTFNVAAKTENPVLSSESKPFKLETPSMLPEKPTITSVQATNHNSVIISFEESCPATGRVTYDVRFKCNGCPFLPKHGTYQRDSHTIELTDLLGGHYYDVWLVATGVDCDGPDCSVSTESKVAFIECEYQCRDGTCVNRGWNVHCDFQRDCPDGSDEDNCPCDPPRHFRCGNNYCIDAWRRCDGNADCNDFSDEAGCPTCHESQFRCDITEECIPKNMTCDRKLQCRDGSDENGCAYWTSSCWPEQFRCLDHTCVDIRHRCDGIWDCVAGEDELSCNTVCLEPNKFECKNRQCIDRNKYCDGEVDCDDGSDERFECNCHKTGQFACRDERQCIARLKVCDGTMDCHDGSDELHCGGIRPRNNGNGRHGNATLIPVSNNNREVVVGAADKEMDDITTRSYPVTHRSHSHTTTMMTPEEDATEDPFMDYNEIRPIMTDSFYDTDLEPASQIKTTTEPPPALYSVKVYPDDQWVYAGNDVVVQCRDEGNLRAEVKWKLKGSVRLPRNATQDRGRLTLPRIRRKQGGVYECYVPGAEDERGAVAQSHVQVRRRTRP